MYILYRFRFCLLLIVRFLFCYMVDWLVYLLFIVMRVGIEGCEFKFLLGFENDEFMCDI